MQGKHIPKDCVAEMKYVRISFLAISVIFIASSCSTEPNTPEINSDIVINSGSSFGECGGYCWREIQITGNKVVFEARSWGDENYQDKRLEGSITSEDWNTLVELIDMSALLAYEDRIGCPDCADGGAEWIQIQTTDTLKKVLFEYGDSLAAIQPLLDKMRSLREQYNEMMFP